MENLLVFICQNQNEAEQLAVISTNVDAHRYFIIVGFEINKQSSFFLETDSFLMLEKIDLKNKEQMARLCLLYSLPNFENILIINNNKMFVEKEVKHVFLNLKNTLDDLYTQLSEFQYNVETIITGVDEKGDIISPGDFTNLSTSAESNIRSMSSKLNELVTNISGTTGIS